jgi:hypothetical protein
MPNWHWRLTPLIRTDFHDGRVLLHLASAIAAEAAEMLEQDVMPIMPNDESIEMCR